MASVLTMTLPPSQSTRATSPLNGYTSDRNSFVSSAASFHTAPGYVSRTSLHSSSRSSSANTLSALSPAPGSHVINPIHVFAETAQHNSAPTEEQTKAVRTAASAYDGKPTISDIVVSNVEKTIATVTDAVWHQNENAEDQEEPTTPIHTPRERRSSEQSSSPSTVKMKQEIAQDGDALRRVPFRSGTVDAVPIRRQTSGDTTISYGSTVRTVMSVPSSQRNTRVDGQSDSRLMDSSIAGSSSLVPLRATAGESLLHPSSAASTSTQHRPHRRNTTGSVAGQPAVRPSRHLAAVQHHTSIHVPSLADSSILLDPDILEQADQIRRERLTKRAKAQQETEAALTRAQSKKSVDEDKVLVGNLIGEDHVNYVLMYNMLTGIRVGVSRCQAKIKRPLTDEDFVARHKFSFDIVGNELTPSAKYDFKFKDYAPWVFRELREDHFRLDPADYLLSLTAKYILSELGSPGKSGSFFYFSRDYRFIIKTIHHSEHKFLLSILKEYYNHVKANPNTLLSRFYGLHRVKLPRGRKIHFVIMNNLFPPHRDIHETYDLKGSTVGRLYPEEKAVQNPRAVLKDVNWINRHRQLELGPEKRALLTEQLRIDTEFLKRINVMDYSLLVGIHNMRRGNRDNLRSNTLKVFSPDMPYPIRRRTSRANAIKEAAVAIRKAMRESDPKALSTETSQLNEEPVDDRQYFVFYQDEGGYRATDEYNNSQDTIYYLGIIDICTPYGVFKKLEHLWKGLSADRHKISPVKPIEYAQRFFNFLTSVMRGGGGGERFKAE